MERTEFGIIGATVKVTHQNPEGLSELESAFGVKDSMGTSYREVFLSKDGNTGAVSIGLKGGKLALIATLDDVAKRTLLAFLLAKGQRDE